MSKNQCELLLVGQTPPPYHGQSVMTEMLFTHDWGEWNVQKIRMSYSDSIDAVGKASLGKVFHLFVLIWQTWKAAIIHQPKVLYYLPASANTVPVVRDIIYLVMVRWCFPKTVFHYHAGGLPKFLQQNAVLGYFASKVYARADMSIDVIRTEPPTGSSFSSVRNVAVNNGVTVESATRKRDPDGVFQILFVGVLNEGKGVKEIVKTAALLKQTGCDFEIKIVGAWSSPDFQMEVEALVRENGVEEYINFTGPLQGSEKWQAYADADCFFFPSHYEAETFGLVLVEAMAFGLPLVTTRWSGIPYVVEGGECAFLCDIKSPSEFSKALSSLANDLPLRQRMGEAACDHYEKNYTKECFLRGMQNAFSEVIVN